MLGWQPEVIVGRPLADIVHSDDFPQLQRTFEDHFTTRTESVLVHRLLKKDGSHLWAETTSKTRRDPASGNSEAVEDYAKAIYALAARTGEPVTTTALAARLGVSPGSVTAMLKRMGEMKLVRHEPYHGVALTPAGEKVALEVIRHHRLLESYLTEALGMPCYPQKR